MGQKQIGDPGHVICIHIVVFLPNSERIIRIKLLIDVATIVLQNPYHEGLNKIK